ncbi:hypothetical protein BAY61_31735 (plasmid) [Prauserella marina]|uniref:Uncharacterized protein n=1 Tax=Prauserella marina TaxID=530584 RepID=A0A222W145_9PSEU|nr:hypothetical protein [Prauserella marina]ASR39860.1 hypothetical protein BAY61_31735 [Prauserella marina]PWV71351.1 hypothetical protein DES30_11267 [Prauserella marina]SDD95999.1 hypothetical protein SAMN05421630_11545 [Prauserella marina]
MTVTTARPSTLDVDDDEMTTADYARMVASGQWATPNQRPTTAVADNDTEQVLPAAAGKTKTNSKPTSANTDEPKEGPEAPAKAKAKAKAKTRPEAENADRRSHLMDAAHWTPGDYVAIAPSPLREAVADHRIRAHAMESPAGRFLYSLYATPMTVVGVTLNGASWTTAKLSALLNDPRHSRRPGSLTETVTLHTERANNLPFTPLKVLYCGYAAPVTAASVVLNAIAWLAAHSAVALNDPKRLGRVLLAVLFVALVVGGFSVML